MHRLSPRLGYYVISLGTVIQFLGLSAGSWLSDSSPNSNGGLTFSHPGDVLLVLGMAITVAGVLLGFVSLAETMPNERDRSPRLLPALPLVLLVGLSIGSVAFAYQAGSNSSNSVVASEASGDPGAVQTPFVIASPGPEDCPEGTLWHPVMQHCMTPEAIAALENAQCPDGYTLDPGTLTCVPSSKPEAGKTPTISSAATPVCPNGYFWHPVMNHCMETSTVVCPTGYQWSTALLSCAAISSGGTITTPVPNETPSCPADTYWHPVMNHCMSNVCPPGFQYDYTYATCLQVARPTVTSTPVPTDGTPGPTTGTPVPTATPTPTGTPPPSCPDGYFWHPDMGHCMSNTCPPGLEWDPGTLYCVLPGASTPVATETPQPTATPTPPPGESCPDGYFWHPDMGHCMSNTCPPGLEWDPGTLYCVLPGSGTPVPTPTATPAQCPDGYYFNPTKGHCDSRECPPGLVFDADLLNCIPSTPATPTGTPLPSCPDGYFWHPDMGHCMSNTCPPGLIFDATTLYCVLPP